MRVAPGIGIAGENRYAERQNNQCTLTWRPLRLRGEIMEKNNQARSDSQGTEKSHGLLNVLKMIILVLILIGAWFLLDWLINGK